MTMLNTLKKMEKYCFNPCFSGSYIMTVGSKANSYREKQFQSLF